MAARLGKYDEKAMQLAIKRAAGTVARRSPLVAAGLISQLVLNVTPNKVRPLISATADSHGSSVTIRLKGLRKRIPLHEFTGASWGGRNTPGAVVQVYRDTGPRVYSSSANRYAVFANPKKGGVRGGLFSRYGDGRAIVQRSGPELTRAVIGKEHGNIAPNFVEFSTDLLVEDIARQFRGGA